MELRLPFTGSSRETCDDDPGETRKPTSGQIVAMDLSFHTTPSDEKFMILHFADEASRYHTAKITREDRRNTYSELGNGQAEELIDAIPLR